MPAGRAGRCGRTVGLTQAAAAGLPAGAARIMPPVPPAGLPALQAPPSGRLCSPSKGAEAEDGACRAGRAIGLVAGLGRVSEKHARRARASRLPLLLHRLGLDTVRRVAWVVAVRAVLMEGAGSWQGGAALPQSVCLHAHRSSDSGGGSGTCSSTACQRRTGALEQAQSRLLHQGPGVSVCGWLACGGARSAAGGTIGMRFAGHPAGRGRRLLLPASVVDTEPAGGPYGGYMETGFVIMCSGSSTAHQSVPCRRRHRPAAAAAAPLNTTSKERGERNK